MIEKSRPINKAVRMFHVLHYKLHVGIGSPILKYTVYIYECQEYTL